MATENNRFFGFYTITGFSGRVSVQVASSVNGYATERTARAKLADVLTRRKGVHLGSDIVCSFPSYGAMLAYLTEVNKLVSAV